jgi:hypothetical protein
VSWTAASGSFTDLTVVSTAEGDAKSDLFISAVDSVSKKLKIWVIEDGTTEFLELPTMLSNIESGHLINFYNTEA